MPRLVGIAQVSFPSTSFPRIVFFTLFLTVCVPFFLSIRDLTISLPVTSLFLSHTLFCTVLFLSASGLIHCHSPESLFLSNSPPQDFPLLRLDDVVDDQSNIVGFSMFNTTHPFYLEFIRSLNLSWREGCDLTYPGPAVSLVDT